MPTQIRIDDITLLKPDENDEIQVLSEQMTCDWIGLYLAEMTQVESFFVNKLEDLISQFIQLQDKFRIKADRYEDEKANKDSKKAKKESQPL